MVGEEAPGKVQKANDARWRDYGKIVKMKRKILKKILEDHYSCGLIPSLKLPDWCCSVCSLKGKLQPAFWEVEAIEEDDMEHEEDMDENFKDETEADQSCNANEEELLALIDSM